jgi:hypothetical protein
MKIEEGRKLDRYKIKLNAEELTYLLRAVGNMSGKTQLSLGLSSSTGTDIYLALLNYHEDNLR